MTAIYRESIVYITVGHQRGNCWPFFNIRYDVLGWGHDLASLDRETLVWPWYLTGGQSTVLLWRLPKFITTGHFEAKILPLTDVAWCYDIGPWKVHPWAQWNAFRLTNPLCGETAVKGELPSQRVCYAGFVRLNTCLNKQKKCRFFETPRLPFDINVMGVRCESRTMTKHSSFLNLTWSN